MWMIFFSLPFHVCRSALGLTNSSFLRYLHRPPLTNPAYGLFDVPCFVCAWCYLVWKARHFVCSLLRQNPLQRLTLHEIVVHGAQRHNGGEKGWPTDAFTACRMSFALFAYRHPWMKGGDCAPARQMEDNTESRFHDSLVQRLSNSCAESCGNLESTWVCPEIWIPMPSPSFSSFPPSNFEVSHNFWTHPRLKELRYATVSKNPDLARSSGSSSTSKEFGCVWCHADVIPICKVWDVGSIHGTESWPFGYGKTFCHLIFLDRENARVDIDYTALTLETLRKNKQKFNHVPKTLDWQNPFPKHKGTWTTFPNLSLGRK